MHLKESLMDETESINHIIHVCHATGATHWVFAVGVIHSLLLLCVSGLIYSIYWWDVHLMMVTAASIFNAVLGICLKYLFRIHRRLENCGVGYAMPSSHTFLATFLVAYFSYLFYEASKCDGAPAWRLRTRILLNLIYLLCISYAKVYIGHNTWQDASVGWMLGGIYAFCFIYIVSTMYDKEMIYHNNEKYD